MDVFAALRFTLARLQVPVAVCHDVGGRLKILVANVPCAGVFGYPKAESLVSLAIEDLIPAHDLIVVDRWRDFDGVRCDGTSVPVSITVTDVRDDDEHYMLAVFYDRTSNVAEVQRRDAERAREVTTLVAAQRVTQQALDETDKAREEAELARAESDKLREESEVARQGAETRLLDQQRLSGQMHLLRQVFTGTLLLVLLLGVLIVAQWTTDGNAEGLTMVKDILLVLTGILGSAMSSMFDSRNRDRLQ
jgi:hypothetical protein